MRTTWIGMVVLFPFLLAAAPQRVPLMKAMLDGKWKVTITPDEDTRQGGERDIKDTLTFKGGKFTSDAFEKRGFEAVMYEEEMHPGGVGGFSALQINKSPEEGTAKWSGFVSNPELTGDLVVKKKDGTVLTFAFRGEKAP